ncbi:aryl-sulfate sulfotransferase [Maribacter sp. 1_MG-2023]|uniref:aryl-sulfate sulfotransferase n=1 Tax=Maribacter sp. 1_MG-2023 TaxID=3062677 RepID=UPI0026E3309E|nr:aryl-sulfate sulfotransferase [Maribacter sp. 1_MG-2023]MDO6470141.1 aryl-sulfate sulfotransferase [Maribacter sp. 1_MG-2023]
MAKLNFINLKTGIFCLFYTFLTSCSSDNNTTFQSSEENIEITDTTEEEIEESAYDTTKKLVGELGNVTIYNQELITDHYILVNDAAANSVYLMDKNADLIYQWPLGERIIGNDVLLLDDGTLLASLESDNTEFAFGGQGGIIQIINKSGDALWNFEYSNTEHRFHHDVELLPNGNILAIAWEKMTAEEAISNGYQLNNDIYPESIIEINPTTNEIVWEWHSKNHLIQNLDDTKLNFGNIEDNPQLINLNYVEAANGNIMHANGISYDDVNDLIFLSVNYYSEVWVIDHSTNAEETTSHSGGNFNRGGDLVYRFGNPTVQNDNITERLFVNNHYPNLFEQGKILVYTNGGDLEQSTVYEFQLPTELSQNSIPTITTPEILWSFTNSELYSPKVSGAVRLPNGNTLITEGDFGIWEVTQQNEVVWKFSAQGFFWRAYHYAKDDPAIIALDL